MIVAFGDSLTAGFGVAAGLSYPDFLQKELDRSSLTWRVVNAGISGDTTAGGLSRVGHLIASKPAIVILALGGNDGLRGLPLSATRANLEQIIAALLGAEARVILAGITLPPNYGADYIRSFEQIYRDLAARHKLKLIPFLLEGAWPKHMLPDGIHANAQGNQIVAGVVLRALEPLLKKPAR